MVKVNLEIRRIKIKGVYHIRVGKIVDQSGVEERREIYIKNYKPATVGKAIIELCELLKEKP